MNTFPIMVLGFLSLHGLLFLGAGYAVSYESPGFSIAHSGIGIFVYMIFFAVLFQKHFKWALIGAIITIAAGFYWGDFLMDHFYPRSVERTIYHKIYAAMMALYIYVYLDLAFVALKEYFHKP